MEDKNLASINWQRPTPDDLRTLYFGYMDLLTLAVVHYENINEDPSPYIFDDARTVLCYGAGLTIDQFNSLTARGAKALAKEGVPEFFITDLAEETGHDIEDLIGVLAWTHGNYLLAVYENNLKFHEIIARQKGIN